MTWADWIEWLAYFIALFSILIGWGWTTVLYFASMRYLKELKTRPAGKETEYLWVFMVPALNEGVTIADSVSRLLLTEATHRIILAINDGSEDDTGDVLHRLKYEEGVDELEIFTRVPPDAHIGKAAALNAAYRHVRDNTMRTDKYKHWQAENVIFVIVDADGRLDVDAPVKVSTHFDDARVGGVQVGVKIYNRTSWLTKMQGLEFKIFGLLYQCGRALWGAAFMGGNGQFNRMKALESVATEEGPWSHYLTEDQELGLRLLERGWRGEHEPYTFVNQQGLHSLKKLYKQRTRWLQGNLQVFFKADRVYSHYLVGVRRFDALFTLLMPILQVIVGSAIIIAVVLAVFFDVPFFPLGSFWGMVFVLALALGPTAMGVLVQLHGRPISGIWKVLSSAPSYILYTNVMWPVVFMGVWKMVRGNTVWDKTAREKIKQ